MKRFHFICTSSFILSKNISQLGKNISMGAGTFQFMLTLKSSKVWILELHMILATNPCLENTAKIPGKHGACVYTSSACFICDDDDEAASDYACVAAVIAATSSIPSPGCYLKLQKLEHTLFSVDKIVSTLKGISTDAVTRGTYLITYSLALVLDRLRLWVRL